MITQEIEIANRTLINRVPETLEDFKVFQEWLHKHKEEWLGCDTETTGLDIYSDDFEVRTLQFAYGLESWVINLQSFTVDKDELLNLKLIFQNAPYDVQAIERFLGISLNWDNLIDTKILAHLVDPRSVAEGGPGLSLEDLCRYYLDPKLADEVKGSMTQMARELKVKKRELFKTIDPWNEDYLRYAGCDPAITWALYRILLPKVPESSRNLIRTEMEVARVCTTMAINGIQLDQHYAENLIVSLEKEDENWNRIALEEFEVEKVNSNQQVAEALVKMGVTLTEKTPSGQYKLSQDILKPLAEKGNRLAQAVLGSKQARKRRATWIETFIAEADKDSRCHPTINSLQARTGRMSITGIPVQQLPSSDWRVRRCFVPEEGYSMVSCDYQSQELRVLAALSGDENMKQTIAEDGDLHQMTADASGVERKVGKTVNFAYVYGSGPRNIAATCGITVDKAREVIKGFERTYPRVKELSLRLQKEARSNGFIVTPTGRKLPVDPERPYAALNYMVQSTSRDITAAALLRLDKAGMTDFLRLPIHDEILACVPEDKAHNAAKYIADVMSCDFFGVHIGTDADVLGKSWGGGYLPEDGSETNEYNATFKR